MGKLIELDIIDLAHNGKSVGYDDGKVTFVNGGLPGERIEAEIVQSKRRHNQARLLRIISRSDERIDPICPHFEICGGCTWQDLAYERQLHYKKQQILACLGHIGGMENIAIDDVRPSPEQFFYRNKMEFSFHVEPQSASGFVLGLHERGRFDRIFDVSQCRLQSGFSNELVIYLREKIAELKIPAYDLVSHQGFIRFAIIREGKNTGHKMLVLVTAEGDFERKEELAAALVSRFPEITTIVWMVNHKLTNIARGKIRQVLYGSGYIEEDIRGLRFRISPASFFQTNSRQAEYLYGTALAMADLKIDDNLLDMYCGTGTIGICAASQVGQVIGIDIEREAIAVAEANAEINGIDNISFFAGDVRQVLASEEMKGIKFDVVIIDPPRAGLHPKALKQVIEIAADRVVYISCNPATFARDAARLRDNGYLLQKISPFDMFPHTMHIESVASFNKCD